MNATIAHAFDFQHRTVDLKVDIKAPIIIIPENITQETGLHMVIDAGHISMKSELANQEAMQEMRSKRSQKYSDGDWKRLESMMYDKFHIDLDSTQVCALSRIYRASVESV